MYKDLGYIPIKAAIIFIKPVAENEHWLHFYPQKLRIVQFYEIEMLAAINSPKKAPAHDGVRSCTFTDTPLKHIETHYINSSIYSTLNKDTSNLLIYNPIKKYNWM